MADVTPVDYATPVGRIRKYIPDIVQAPDPSDPDGPVSYMWADDALESFLEDSYTPDPTQPGYIPRQAIWRAAAAAMIATANNENLILKKIVTEDLQTDGPAVAKAMIAGAKELLKRAEDQDLEEGMNEVFLSVPYVHTPPRYDWR